MSQTTTVALILFGLILFVGSCAPLGIVIYHEAVASPTNSYSLSGTDRSELVTFNSDPGTLVRFAIEAKINTASVQEDLDSLDNKYLARFRFPISYTIRDANGDVLTNGEELLTWKGGRSITKSNEQTTSTSGTLNIVSNFDKFPVPADGTINITIEINPDTTYDASISLPRLHFYEGMIDNTRYIIGTAIMFFAGFIMAMVGFIFTVSNSLKITGQQDLAGRQAVAEGGIMQNKEITQQAMFIQLSALAGYVIPFGSIILPLVLWMVWRDKDPYLNDMGREAVNFQLSMLIYYLICIVLFFVVIGMFLLIPVIIFHITYIIIASVQTSKGVDFRYPLNIRFIKA